MGIFHYHVYPRVRNIFNKIKEKIHDVFGCIYSQYQRKVWRLNAKSLPKRNISPTSRHISDIWCSFPPRWDMDTTFLGGYTYVYLHSYHIQIYIYTPSPSDVKCPFWSERHQDEPTKGSIRQLQFCQGGFFSLRCADDQNNNDFAKASGRFCGRKWKTEWNFMQNFCKGVRFLSSKMKCVCIYIYIVSDIYIYIL